MPLNYRAIIQDNFTLKTKDGSRVPFIFNDTQNYLYDLLLQDYPEMQGIRENWLKFRQWGGSTLVSAIFTVDFLFGELEEGPITASDIYSHKDKETKAHMNRVSGFIDDFLDRRGLEPLLGEPFPRKKFLEEDTDGQIVGKRESSITSNTASAKVSGRGDTKQNILWTEAAFYSNTEIMNAESLIIGAEKQVMDGIGKIIRESTGNMEGDFFHTAYEKGKDPESAFTSRFLGWWTHKEYTKPAPASWELPSLYQKLMADNPEVTRDQCYWHFRKIQDSTNPDKEKREYPMDDIESFMQQGARYFDMESLRYYTDHLVRQPLPGGFI